MKRSIAAAQQKTQMTNLEKMVAAIYEKVIGEPAPSNLTEETGEAINLTDGVDDNEAKTAGRALRARRKTKAAEE